MKNIQKRIITILWVAGGIFILPLFLNFTPAPDTSLPELSFNIPRNITFTGDATLHGLQNDFDTFSWNAFIALNWPANSDGNPNTKINIGEKDLPTVWESWISSSQVFLPDGSKPDWDNRPLPSDCDSGECSSRVLSMVGKTPNLLDVFQQPFKTGPLIDRNGKYTRYEILVNDKMFNYIVQHELYNTDGQKKVAEIDFPESNKKIDSLGAIMVKASWKVLGATDDKSKFHAIEALVYNTTNNACEKTLVGLVGFHIGHKTSTDPQWVWSTFEHKDNCPEENNIDPHRKYHYYNHDSDSPVNEPPPRPWDPATEYTTPSQVVRVIPITEQADSINNVFHESLKKINPESVWQNYILVSTQWPTDPTSRIDESGNPFPIYLANTTLETYIQGEIPEASSNCIKCHLNATTTTGMKSDFTYLLQLAQPKKGGSNESE